MIGIILYFDRVLFFRHENPSVHLLVSFFVVRFFGKASKLASQRREIVTLPEITATYFFVGVVLLLSLQFFLSHYYNTRRFF